MNKLVLGAISTNDLVSKAALDRFVTLSATDKLKKLQCCLDSEGYAIILEEQKSKFTNV